jgi:hypothetical protein
VTGPSDEELLAAAGSARYSRVLVRGELGDLAVAIADANGDGVTYVCVTMTRFGGRWVEVGWIGAGILAEDRAYGVAYAYGRTPGADAVEVGFRGVTRRVPVNEHGWWLVLEAADEDERFDLTRVPDPFPPRQGPFRPGPPRIAG